MNQRDRFLKNAAHVCRLTVGLLFIVAGFVKAVDPWGTSLIINDYLISYGLEWAMPAGLILSIWVSGAELMMGCMLTFKVRIQLVSIFALFSTFVFTIVTLMGATILPVEDCGCLGKAIHFTPWETFFKNLILLPMTFTVFWRYNRSGISSLRHFKVSELLLATTFFTLSMGLGAYCYLHLPLVDFLPYKIGVNLLELRNSNDNSNDYTTTLVYQNLESGKLREFSLEDTEWHNAELWEWVETKNSNSKQSNGGIVAEFTLQDRRGVDRTEEILTKRGTVHLLFVDKEKGKSGVRSDKIANFIYSSIEKGEEVICVTTDTISDIYNDIYCDLKYYNMDKTTRNNVMRAKCGVITLVDGVILQKRNCRDIQ